MKLVNRARLATTLMVGALLGLGSMAANAAVTTAGTPISNTATVDYKVGGNAQTPIASSPTGNSTPGTAGTPTLFVVDAKLALTVSKVDTTIVNVSPGQSLAVLTYKVTNNGNAIQGALLSAGSLANGTANPFSGAVDDFDSTAAVVHVSANNTATYNNTNDTATSIPQLAIGASAYVFVTSTIPTAQANGDVAVMSLTATVADKGAAATYGSAPGAASVDQSGTAWTSGNRAALNIFADAAGTDDLALDGKSSDRDAYLVQSAKLTISKTSSVITDPIYCTTPGVASSCTIPVGKSLHSIPGAAVQYTITVASCDTTTCPGAVAATGVSLTDSLATQITAGNIAYVAGSMKVADPSNSNVATSCSDASDADKCSFATNVVSVSGISLNPGQNAAVTFVVTIP
ncbi:hypothetical protein [Rhodanobacter ginsengiterrae]|uniref:hypothetical protein n=1 Tax=Rhodanobacter ginsengiterrae TaxID=2008451 RepID=UPI003CED6F28